ncbi:TPA: RHS repeat-associated core domain-containing protein [Vibrio vulnificus]|nr:hypothetical protein [Vibrio vulnificus]HDU8729666.1 RHS repeat-associated core domain-containing protein [Vibrio vulnificus]HDU8764709.1 RHS repeat-associated core domain-containing protein [Vibrio vulnificus]
MATSSALLTLSPAGRVLAGWAEELGEMTDTVGRMLLRDNQLAFNGERLDPINGLYHLGQGYRAYNPKLMQFNAADSLSLFDGGGITPYGYCLGDPINFVDPTGHISWQAIMGITLGIIAIGLAVVTLGTAIPASVALATGSAALTAAAVVQTTLGVVAGVTGLTSGVLAVTSGAISESDPVMSRNLGYAALAFGAVSAVTGLGAFAVSRMAVSTATSNASTGTVRLLPLAPKASGKYAIALHGQRFNNAFKGHKFLRPSQAQRIANHTNLPVVQYGTAGQFVRPAGEFAKATNRLLTFSARATSSPLWHFTRPFGPARTIYSGTMIGIKEHTSLL